MFSAALNKLVVLVFLAGIAAAGFFFLPQILESAGSACAALERKELRMSAQTRGDPVWSALQSLSNGAYAEQVMRVRRPDTAPLISCAEAYWFGSGRNDQKSPMAGQPPVTGSPATDASTDFTRLACRGAPKAVIDRAWQVSAPRERTGVLGSGPIQIGLRNKTGQSNEQYRIVAELSDGDFVSDSKVVTLAADQWAYLSYPEQFAHSKVLKPGLYTVAWKTDEGVFLACDGLYVGQ